MSAEPMPSDPEPPRKNPPGVLNLSPILSGYEGKWVALTRALTAVVASGNDYGECRRAVVQKDGNTASVSFLRIPPKGVKLLY